MNQEERDVFDEVFAEDDSSPAQTPEEATPEQEPVEQPDAQVEEPTPTEEPDYKALYEQEHARYESMKGRVRSYEQQQQQRPVATPEPTQPPADPDEEFMAKFRKEYSDEVVRAMEIMSERKAREYATRVLQEKVMPIEEVVRQRQIAEHFDTLARHHPDWEQVAQDEKFAQWIDSQPPYIAQTYRHVASQGTTGDVVDLLNRYKREAGLTPVAAPTPASSAKAQAAAPVKTQRGTLPKGRASVDDFDAAWDEAPD